ncbi:lysine--tRNA ligase [Candidatus Parcubacteria bacterium]|nr:lysine--tRNA ligase [Candidatus Parcubacteria bacterium]
MEEIREARLRKLEILKEKGINPYPIDSHFDKTLKEVLGEFESLKDKGKLTLLGRILSIRAQGKIVFFDIHDGTGKFQGLLKRGEPTSESDFDLFNETFDIGDFIEVKGTLFLTKKEEKTILVESLRMLSKSLRPLPEKWHGLTDTEERFRKRYLDTLSNEEVKTRFITRARVVQELRRALEERGFIETETPALQPLYGGASAEPFVTHHNALDMDLYLRISDELYLKRLLIGGFPRVYEFARDFRNEGIDSTHNPEFTMLEFYEAYSDAEKQREFVEDMIRRVVKAVSSDGIINFDENRIDFNSKFKVEKYADVLSAHTELIDPLNATREDLVTEAERLGVEVEHSDSAVKILDGIFKRAVRPNLMEPTFLIDYPVDYLPLTKRLPLSDKLVDAFQFYAGSFELVKAFSELNDPLDQRARFEAQEKVLKKGEKDAQPLDEEFLEAMEYGMPPAGGVGIGIDRLTMLLTGARNIKEVILFPTLRPRND